MRDFRLKALDHFEQAADAELGRRSLAGSTSTTSSTTSSRPRSRARPGTTSRSTSRTPSRSWASPRRSASSWPASAPSTSRRSSTTRCARTSQKQGVIFLDTDSGVREYPDLVKQYFGTIIPANDNKFAALNSAVWSGGSFIYVPEGVKVDVPLQAYFRINAENMGQFERTLIICEPGTLRPLRRRLHRADLHHRLLHSAVVEIIVKEGARCRYTTIQNWSKNVYNLVTKRAVAYKNATMEWVDGNLGSQADDEVPGRLADGGGRARRDPLGRLRRRRPAPGRRRQGRPRRAAHLVARSSRSRSRRGPAARRYRGLVKVYKGARGRQEQRRLRRAAARRDQQDRHLPVHRDRGGARSRSATRPPSPRWRRSSSSICRAAA